MYELFEKVGMLLSAFYVVLGLAVIGLSYYVYSIMKNTNDVCDLQDHECKNGCNGFCNQIKGKW